MASEIPAHEVVEQCEGSFIEKFFDLCFSSFDNSEVKKMMLIQNFEDLNTPGVSICNPHTSAISVVWNFYDKISTR